MDFIGEWLAAEVKGRIINTKIPPALASPTVGRKGHDHPLVDTGLGATSIEHRVTTEGNTVTLGVGIFDENVAGYMAVHEFGSGHVPSRSFLRTTFDENEDEIARRVLNKAAEGIVELWAD